MKTRRPAPPVPLLILTTVLAVVLAACGIATADDAANTAASTDSAATSLFLTEDEVHDISVELDQSDYEASIAAYEENGSKEWIAATVTIDGATYTNAGIRLKGNSSLFGIAGGPGHRGGAADDSSPETLPWLIRLDKYVDGQNHKGIYNLVVRSNNTTTALNEAVALDLLEKAGLASQDSAYAAFSVNGSDPTLRLVVELPDEVWLQTQFSDEGTLYKAEATGDYSYRGDDPDAYDEVFDVEAGVDDLAPLLEFLDFINNADDETFYAELDGRFNVQSLATYLAAQELIANSDDIDGRGNNSYLYYDPESSAFTVVPWDHNLAFGAMNGGGAGGFTPGDAAAVPGGPAMAAPSGGDTQERRAAPEGGFPRAEGGAGASNVLVERFLADADYASLVDSELTRLTAELYDSGIADTILAKWVAVVESSGLVDAATVSQQANTISDYFG